MTVNIELLGERN